MPKQLFIFAAMLLGFAARAQPPASLSFRNIGINQGLSQSSVVDIAIDSAGFVWMATQDGLNRFDGRDFISFQKNFDDITTTSTNQLGRLSVSNRRELWLLESGGKLQVMDLFTQAFKTPILPEPLPGQRGFTAFLASGTEWWIGTEADGLYVYDTRTKKLNHWTKNSTDIHLPNNRVQEIFRDRNHHFWVLTDSGTIRISNDKKSSSRLPIRSIGYDYRASTVTEDENGYWMGTFGKGLYYKTGSDSIFTLFTGYETGVKLEDDLVIEALLVDQSKRIWVGTYGHGLYIIDPGNRLVQHVTNDRNNPFSLAYDDVLCIRQDKSGGIWIGTDGGGVSYYDQRLNDFKSLTRHNLPGTVTMDQVRSITTDQRGDIWVGTSNAGLAFIKKDLQNAVAVGIGEGINNTNNRIVSLFSDSNDNIWIGIQGKGLLVIDARTRKIRKQFLPGATGKNSLQDHTVWCLLDAGPGRVWAGMRSGGLCLIDYNEGVIQRYSTDLHAGTLLENNVRSLTYAGKDTIAIGFENNGIQFLDIRNGKTFSPASIQKFGVVRSLFYQAPHLWIGTFGRGLARLQVHTGDTLFITTGNGLPNNTIYGILPESKDILWLSTNKGICRFIVPHNGAKVNRGSFSTYTAEDGLQSNEFNTGASFRSKDGRLLFGGINGLSIFDPGRLSDASRDVPVVITAAMVDNQPLKGDTLITYQKHLDLSYSQNSISFNFAAIDVVSAGRMNYFYQLVGYDDGWVDAGNRNYAAYTNLPPGNYMFRVRASRDVSTNDFTYTSIGIRIRPPFWRTWWFIGALIVVAGGILYGIYRYRISQLMQLQKVRNKIASDLHDDIGSTLTNISILSELSRQNIEKQQEASVFLERISEEVQHSGQALDDIVWSINTNNDTLEQTVARMRRYAAEVFDAAGINYVFEFDEKFSHRKINMEQRRDFLLLFKETVNNIYKHAAAKNVLIKTGIERNRLFMNITDDGKGFDPGQPTHRNGLKNMKQRILKWDGYLNITSSPGKGTATDFNFDIS